MCCHDSSMVIMKLMCLASILSTTMLAIHVDSKIPDGCMKQWKSCADKDGYLDWDKFSTGLQLALKEDASRLSRDGEAELPQSEAERKLRALRQAKKEHTGSEQTTRSTPPLSPVGAEEIEMFLSACSREKLTKTLTRLRKDLYKGQLSIHRLTTSSTNSPLKKQHGNSCVTAYQMYISTVQLLPYINFT